MDRWMWCNAKYTVLKLLNKQNKFKPGVSLSISNTYFEAVSYIIASS